MAFVISFSHIRVSSHTCMYYMGGCSRRAHRNVYQPLTHFIKTPKNTQFVSVVACLLGRSVGRLLVGWLFACVFVCEPEKIWTERRIQLILGSYFSLCLETTNKKLNAKQKPTKLISFREFIRLIFSFRFTHSPSAHTQRENGNNTTKLFDDMRAVFLVPAEPNQRLFIYSREYYCWKEEEEEEEEWRKTQDLGIDVDMVQLNAGPTTKSNRFIKC